MIDTLLELLLKVNVIYHEIYMKSSVKTHHKGAAIEVPPFYRHHVEGQGRRVLKFKHRTSDKQHGRRSLWTVSN